jgi:hypothetical protein
MDCMGWNAWACVLVPLGLACQQEHRAPAPARNPAASSGADESPGSASAGSASAGSGALPEDAGGFDASDGSSGPPPRRPGAFANLDPSDDFVVGPPDIIPDCEDQLARARVTFRAASLPVHADRSAKVTCGAPQVVAYVRGPGNIAYDPQPLITCGMALALASYERILQEEASRVLGTTVARVEQLGTYSCRGIVRFKGVISEHSFANAIDLAKFTLKNGKVVTVLHDFDTGDGPPARPAGDFLRAISERGQDEDVFSNVLTPFWDAAHKNHFHLDLARYRVNGVRPLER